MASASQSLNNFSVAGGKDLSPPNGTLLMPKLQYRFRVLFYNFGINNQTQEMTRQVIDVTRPNVSFQKISLPVYNSTIYMPGKHTWQSMTVNLRDDSSGLVSKAVGEQLQKQLDFYEQASAASASDFKYQMAIDILDGANGRDTPVVLERWELYGCYLEAVNYNTLNYGTSEDVKIALTVQFDNALQVEPNGITGSGVGMYPGRAAVPTGTATSIAGGA